ncbi:class I SAM-dependent methyltransferase [Candidatus Gracilibacteria bacterium]|nr:class I SAM-dependent methyltransferase [Candidatus Gracilibacteria bacterium]
MQATNSGDWGAENSSAFINFGRFFVPEREVQLATIAALMPTERGELHILELCCGEGLLAEALLDAHSAATLEALDGSPEMLAAARTRLERFGSRFSAAQFDLADLRWRTRSPTPHAVVSSLAIHHLDGAQKQQLFADMYALLQPGGVCIIADLVAPADAAAQRVAADAWDAAVLRRALTFGNSLAPFAAFEREKWNYYRYPETDPAPFDKPSSLLDQLLWLRAAGFASVDVYWMQAGHAIFGGRKKTA